MTKQLLPIGTRIYNGGDMANPSHFGTVTHLKDDRWGLQYEITADPDCPERSKPYWIPAVMISPEYLGHGGTRIVTEAAYEEWRKARMSALRNSHDEPDMAYQIASKFCVSAGCEVLGHHDDCKLAHAIRKAIQNAVTAARAPSAGAKEKM